MPRERIFDELTRQTFALDVSMRDALERMADARDETMGSVIRDALDERISAFESGLLREQEPEEIPA